MLVTPHFFSSFYYETFQNKYFKRLMLKREVNLGNFRDQSSFIAILHPGNGILTPEKYLPIAKNYLPITKKYLPIGIRISSHYGKLSSHHGKIPSHHGKTSSHWVGIAKMIERTAKNHPKSALLNIAPASSA